MLPFSSLEAEAALSPASVYQERARRREASPSRVELKHRGSIPRDGSPAEMDPIPDLYGTFGEMLHHFLKHSLQPQRDWKEEGQDAWERIEKFFREQCFRDELLLDQEVKVIKVVKDPFPETQNQHQKSTKS